MHPPFPSQEGSLVKGERAWKRHLENYIVKWHTRLKGYPCRRGHLNFRRNLFAAGHLVSTVHRVLRGAPVRMVTGTDRPAANE